MNWFKKFWKALTEAPPAESGPKINPDGNQGGSILRTTKVDAVDNGMSTFTPRAQQVLALARKEAERLNHNFLGTEHLLLGIVKLGQGTAVNVLTKQGINLENLRLEVEKQVGAGPDQKIIGNIPYTPRVKKVIALAQKEAKQFHHTYVGTEHLLLGLLREGDGVAAKVLRIFDVDLEQTRQDILRELEPNFELQNTGAQNMEDPGQLTPRTQIVLKLAREEAARLNHRSVGPEHLLFGLVALGQGVAANALQKMGLNLETLQAAIEKHSPRGAGEKNIENLPYTPPAKEAFFSANTERSRLNHTYLGTEHILLGVLAVKNDAMAKLWADFGIDPQQVRQEILRELDPNHAPPSVSRQPPSVPASPLTASSKPDSVGADKRYDVYCAERGTEMVVYRNALFKGIKRLLNSSQNDSMGQFIELEQANGGTIFISRFSVIKFCEPGTTPGGEIISPKP